MHNKFLSVAMLSAVFAGASVQAGTIFSDSFESPSVSSWKIFQSVGDWITSAGAGIEIQSSGTIAGVDAYDGNQYVELDSDSSNGGLSASTNSAMTRTLDLTSGTYRLEWYYQPRTNTLGDNVINVYLAGASEGLFDHLLSSAESTLNAAWGWLYQSVDFTVDGTDNLYALSFAAGGIENELGGFVDQISLSRVPEPGTVALLGVGLVGLGIARRRAR